jgi:hypothetical protein
MNPGSVCRFAYFVANLTDAFESVTRSGARRRVA